MKYYEVKAKCGHVGRKYYALKSFAIRAVNGREAASIVRSIPRVKHHHKDAIKEVIEIDELRYLEIIQINNDDPYFKCKCVQDQRSYVENEIYVEEKTNEYKDRKQENIKSVFIGKERIRRPKQYIKTRCFEERWAY